MPPAGVCLSLVCRAMLRLMSVLSMFPLARTAVQTLVACTLIPRACRDGSGRERGKWKTAGGRRERVRKKLESGNKGMYKSVITRCYHYLDVTCNVLPSYH